MPTLIPVRTPQCSVCKRESVVMVDADAFKRWREGALIQVAFPDMSKDDREVLMSGIHKDCWKKLFQEED